MRLVLTPTGRSVQNIELPEFEVIGGAHWFPGEKRVFDLSGRLVRATDLGRLSAGRHDHV